MPLPIVVSNILRRVSHNQFPKLHVPPTARVRPYRKQEQEKKKRWFLLPPKKSRLVLECLYRQVANLSRLYKGDMRASENLEKVLRLGQEAERCARGRGRQETSRIGS